ncbi:MAG: DNA internalization-related competence protein ComEC/Rec2 [Pseudomonadota bacterium]
MLAGIVAFTAGIASTLWLPELPAPAGAGLLLLLVPLALIFPWLRLPVLAGCGFFWAVFRADLVLQHGVSPAYEGEDVIATGVVVDIPERRDFGIKFLFDIRELRFQGQLVDSPGRASLKWYAQEVLPELHPGEHWQLRLRLKRPNGSLNPGGFDYERWLFQQGIRAVGYVREAKGEAGVNRALRDIPPEGWIDRLRERIKERIAARLGDSEFAGIITALTIGRGEISQEQWDVLNKTGTNHLMSISGLHIGLVAGLVFLLTSFAWRRSARLCLWLPARQAAALAAVMAALFYSALAGFSIPTQRSLIMITVAMLALLLRRGMRGGAILGIAWLAVLIADPFALMSAGFWLSFAAVAIIFYTMGARTQTRGIWWRFGRLHWLIAIGMIPPLILFFQQAPLHSFAANLIAVPVIGSVMVPAILLAVLLELSGIIDTHALFALIDQVFRWTWPVLERLAGLDFALWVQPPPAAWALVCALVGVTLCLAPAGWPGRWVGIVWMLPMLMTRPPAPGAGDVWLSMLDVGQGLAVVVRTERHTLVYDTGAKASENFDMASAVVIPYLQNAGIRRVDRVILSHDDIDHIGAADELLARFPEAAVFTPAIARYQAAGAADCRAGMRWEWDGVGFEFIHPDDPREWREDNNRSCVLRIEASGGSVLITGDIERKVEARLLQQGRLASADILFAPHHGSGSSSSNGFIEAVAAKYVLFSSGYRNRFHHPKTEIVNNYRETGAEILDTAREGAVEFVIDAKQGILPPRQYRRDHVRFWRRG